MAFYKIKISSELVVQDSEVDNVLYMDGKVKMFRSDTQTKVLFIPVNANYKLYNPLHKNYKEKFF